MKPPAGPTPDRSRCRRGGHRSGGPGRGHHRPRRRGPGDRGGADVIGRRYHSGVRRRGLDAPEPPPGRELGLDDSRDEALAYMTRLTAGRYPGRPARALRRPGPGHRGRLREAGPPAAPTPMSWPDYHPEMDGAKASGRMLEPRAVRHRPTRPLGRPAPTPSGARSAHDPAGVHRRLAAGLLPGALRRAPQIKRRVAEPTRWPAAKP